MDTGIEIDSVLRGSTIKKPDKKSSIFGKTAIDMDVADKGLKSAYNVHQLY